VTAAPQGRVAYETWVLTLRAWAEDPLIAIDHLPPLDDATFTPDTYARLFEHLLAALEKVSNRWHDGLERAWKVSHDRFALAQELVALRASLARRVQLASHPSLPEGARTVLRTRTWEDVHRYQREIEEAVVALGTDGTVGRDEVEEMLAVVRENPFTAVLGYTMSFDGGRLDDGPLREVDTSGPITPRSRVRRIDPTSFS
jgi:hypothetical protein